MSRQVGIEVEFAGIEFDAAAALISATLDSEAKVISPHEHEFDSPCGAYRLEVDFELLKRLSRKEHEATSETVLRRAAVGALEIAASVATPMELVSPPLPLEHLDEFVLLLDRLAGAGAQGTGESLMYAFGVHFNPSAEVNAGSIAAHLRAFLCLHDWLKARDEMDITRVLSAFAKPFPLEFERLVLSPGYAPPAPALIDDYLAHNPTRNRALDLLPLLCELDEPRVRAVIDDERVNARPTYHYRLPNSGLGQPGWTVLKPWHDWLEVERLAADARRLESLCRQRVEHLDKNVLMRLDSDWIEICERNIDDR